MVPWDLWGNNVWLSRARRLDLGMDWSRLLGDELDFNGPVSRQSVFWAHPEMKGPNLSCSGNRKRLTLVMAGLEKCPMSPEASAALRCVSPRSQALPRSWNK